MTVNGGNGERTLWRTLALWALAALQAIVLWQVQEFRARILDLEVYRQAHALEAARLTGENNLARADLRHAISDLARRRTEDRALLVAVARRVGVRVDQAEPR